MNFTLRRAKLSDLAGIEELYDNVCDRLAGAVNYPGWRKGIYPTGEDALAAIREKALYLALDGEKIAGSLILRHRPEEGYRQVRWLTEDDYSRIYVLYTLAVGTGYLRKGAGRALMEFAEEKARKEGCISLRLDAVKGNLPAQRLYEKCGFHRIATVSLGYEAYGLPFYDLYEKPLES